MLLCVDEQSPVITKGSGTTRRFVDQLKSMATTCVVGNGPMDLCENLMTFGAWDDEIVVLGSTASMAAAVTAWVNTGRPLPTVRWTYLSAPVADGWTDTMKCEDAPLRRWNKLSRRVRTATVRTIRIDVTTEELPRYGLSAAFGGAAGLWDRLAARSGSAMDWPKLTLDWVASLRDGIPEVASELSLDGQVLEGPANFASVYSIDPFLLFRDSPEVQKDGPLTWRSTNVSTAQFTDFLKTRDFSRFRDKRFIGQASLRSVRELSVDGWSVKVSRGGVVRIGRGPEIHLRAYGSF